MDSFEILFKQQGSKLIVGLDEVGRGPLAGPVCAAAVILPDPIPERIINTVKDSKSLSAAKRERLFDFIMEDASHVSIGEVDETKIDEINILEATKLAMIRALDGLSAPYDMLLIDGNFKLDVDTPQESIIKGDSKSISIAAASIVAKVHRDRLMDEYHEKYPEYGFAKNKGYGTKEHCDAIKAHGVCEIHRKSFKRVKEFV